jgi:hypothetical protein
MSSATYFVNSTTKIYARPDRVICPLTSTIRCGMLPPLAKRLKGDGLIFRTKCDAERYVGGLSKPSKMPCAAFSLAPIATCPSGAKLAKMLGSVCSECYGLKNNYRKYLASMLPAWQRRLEGTRKPYFASAMAKLVEGAEFFRWHDTGDVYSSKYMTDIIATACKAPDTRFWLPTRELSLVSRFADLFPPNLLVRVSLPTINPPAHVVKDYLKRYGFISTVAESGYSCPASENDNKCGSCRDCWDTVPIVSYKYH